MNLRFICSVVSESKETWKRFEKNEIDLKSNVNTITQKHQKQSNYCLWQWVILTRAADAGLCLVKGGESANEANTMWPSKEVNRKWERGIHVS